MVLMGCQRGRYMTHRVRAISTSGRLNSQASRAALLRSSEAERRCDGRNTAAAAHAARKLRRFNNAPLKDARFTRAFRRGIASAKSPPRRGPNGLALA